MYGVRICPDKPHYGHLSGCTYSENESWRKADKNGIYAEMLADATQVWPFLVKYLMEKQLPRGKDAEYSLIAGFAAMRVTTMQFCFATVSLLRVFHPPLAMGRLAQTLSHFCCAVP